MEFHPEATQTIFQAIDEINMQRSPDKRLDKSIDTVLHGRASKLDSLGLVNLILITEENVEALLGVKINLADERASSQENNPYRTVGSLSRYIAQLVIEASNDTHQN